MMNGWWSGPTTSARPCICNATTPKASPWGGQSRSTAPGLRRGPFGPAQIFYVRLNSEGEVLAAPRRLSNPEDEGQSGRAPSLALDPEDRLAILWEHQPDPHHRARGLGFVSSPDAGEQLSPMTVIPGSADDGGAVNGSLQGQLARKLSMNSSGRIAVVNSHFLEDEYSRIVLIIGKF